MWGHTGTANCYGQFIKMGISKEVMISLGESRTRGFLADRCSKCKGIEVGMLSMYVRKAGRWGATYEVLVPHMKGPRQMLCREMRKNQMHVLIYLG